MDILIRTLGDVDAERFISLIIREPFDYTKWRQVHLENDSVRTLNRKAMKYSSSLTP